MAGQLPFSNAEKNHLLAEIIKSAGPQPQLLYNVILQNSIQPRWEDMPLPPGRSLNACRNAFEEIRRNTNLGYSPLSQPMPPQTPLSAPILSSKRTRPSESAYPEIRPRPMPGAPYMQVPLSEPAPKRKRGRPTKAEAEAKAQAQAALTPTPLQTMGESSFATRIPAATPVMAASPVNETKPLLPPTSRVPISAMITPTAPKSGSQSSSSSGKRRRGRSLRLEHLNEPSSEHISGTVRQYESPYGRVPDEPDTPITRPGRRQWEGAVVRETAVKPPVTGLAASPASAPAPSVSPVPPTSITTAPPGPPGSGPTIPESQNQ